MHIIHVNLARGFRGGERQTLNLIQGLSKYELQQTLVCRPYGDLLQRATAETNVSVIIAAHPLLGHWDKKEGDLIHVHEGRGIYWAWLEKQWRNTPYLVTRRVVNPISSNWFARRSYAEASVLAGVSMDVAKRLTNQIRKKVEVVLDASSPLFADPCNTVANRRLLGIGPVIGHVGVLDDAIKGQSTLIAAFQKLSTVLPNARLVFVGDGPDRAVLEELAGTDDRILFVGYQKDVGSWLMTMDVFAFPSRIEALGSSVLDAMSMGIPVVTSSAGGLPELIGANERGLIVKSDDPDEWAGALQEMLTNLEMRSRLVDAGRNFSLVNNVATMSQRYYSLYQRILNK